MVEVFLWPQESILTEHTHTHTHALSLSLSLLQRPASLAKEGGPEAVGYFQSHTHISGTDTHTHTHKRTHTETPHRTHIHIYTHTHTHKNTSRGGTELSGREQLIAGPLLVPCWCCCCAELHVKCSTPNKESAVAYCEWRRPGSRPHRPYFHRGHVANAAVRRVANPRKEQASAFLTRPQMTASSLRLHLCSGNALSVDGQWAHRHTRTRTHSACDDTFRLSLLT